MCKVVKPPKALRKVGTLWDKAALAHLQALLLDRGVIPVTLDTLIDLFHDEEP